MPNRDGFEPGQSVSFEDIMRTRRKDKPATTRYAYKKGGPWYRVVDEVGEVVAESVRRKDLDAMGAEVVE